MAFFTTKLTPPTKKLENKTLIFYTQMPKSYLPLAQKIEIPPGVQKK